MNTSKSSLGLTLALTLISPFAPQGATLTQVSPLISSALAKQSVHRLKVDGRRRRFRVHLPRGYKGEKNLPVVIVLHGAASNSFNIGLPSKMSRQADRDGFFAVYPSGTGYFPGCFLTWNAGGCCGPARSKKVDDVAFIDRVIEAMKEQYHIDADRVYVTGMSNGAMMAYRLALELPHKIAAIAPVEGAMMCKKSSLKQVSDPAVSVVAFNGDRDTVIPIEGGVGHWFSFRITCPSAQSSIDFWVERNRCCKQAEIVELNGARKFVYSGGSGDTEVVFYRVNENGHAWPGGPRIPGLLRASKTIEATELMCRFFFAHPKKH